MSNKRHKPNLIQEPSVENETELISMQSFCNKMKDYANARTRGTSLFNDVELSLELNLAETLQINNMIHRRTANPRAASRMKSEAIKAISARHWEKITRHIINDETNRGARVSVLAVNVSDGNYITARIRIALNDDNLTKQWILTLHRDHFEGNYNIPAVRKLIESFFERNFEKHFIAPPVAAGARSGDAASRRKQSRRRS